MDLEFFKKEKITAMKAKDKEAVSALNVIINKLMLATIDKRAKGEELVEADIVGYLQKTEKELIEEREAFAKAGRDENCVSLDKQIEVVGRYMPKLLSKEEIQEIIATLPDKSVPAVMKYFKLNYAGKCDMKLVNEAIRK